MKKISILLFGIISLFISNPSAKAENLSFKLDCDSNIAPGDITKCDLIYGETTPIALTKLKGTYVLPAGFSYVKFIPNEVWNASNLQSNSFNLISTNGLPMNTNVGSLYIKLDKSLITGSEDITINIESYRFKGSTEDITETIPVSDSVYFNNNSNANLASLSISSGELSPEFDCNTLEYTATIDAEKVKIDFIPINSRSNISIESGIEHALSYGTNKIEIKVTSPSSTSKTYTLNLIRMNTRDTNGLLSELSINNEKIDLSQNTYYYTKTVEFDVTLPNITYKPQSSTTKVELIGDLELKVGENNYIIKTTSEAGTTYEYNITITRKSKTLSNTNTLKSLKIKNHNIKFNPSTLKYSVIIKGEKTLDIEAIPTDEYSKVEIKNNKDLKAGKIITIDVISETKITKTYKIYVKEEEKKEINKLIYVAIAVPLILVIGIIIILIKRKNQNKI